MFVKYSFTLIIFFCAKLVFSSSVFKTCKTEDCINSSVLHAIPLILAGFPELGVDTSDPLYIRVLEGNLPGLKYIFRNTTVTGLKDCEVSNLMVSPELKNLHCELSCPTLKMVGKYETSGIIVKEPVEGNGDYTAVQGKYTVIFDSDLKTTSSDGKSYLSIENIAVKCESQDEIHYTFTNLFNGQKELGDRFLNYIHENWRQVQAVLQVSIWEGIMKNVVTNFNKYLQATPLNDFKLN